MGFALLDLASLTFGTLGSILLALSVGELPKKQPGGYTIEVSFGHFAPAVIRSKKLWYWGVGLIAFAFLLQLPETVVRLVNGP